MRTRVFALRTAKEILRDPLNLAFGLGFPAVLLLLLTAIGRNVPVEMFPLAELTPGVSVFSLSFFTLFSAQLVAKDRASAFAARLFTTPMTAWDFIFGYTLPLLPMALAQSLLCYALAVLLGLPLTGGIFAAVGAALLGALFFIGLGLLCGSVMTVAQVGGFCGAVLTNLAGWLSGTWFSPALVGGWFQRLAECLPFLRLTELCRAALAGDGAAAMPHLPWALGYTALALLLAVPLFRRTMRR
ncbi:MAG: ABC transporter permease [Oscillospiraceae bacterium]